MQIQGSSKPRMQPQVTAAQQTGAAAGAGKTEGAAKPAGQKPVAAADNFTAARQQSGVQSASMAKVGGSAEGCIGYCLPPPPKLPLGLMTPAQSAKFDEGLARSNYERTVKDASKDGNITDREQRGVNSAGRDLKIAESKTQLAEKKEAYQSARAQALKDGHISPGEEFKLAMAETKIYGLERKLQGQVAEDKKTDRSDRIANLFDDPGKPPILKQPMSEQWAKGPGGMPEDVKERRPSSLAEALKEIQPEPLIDNPNPGWRWNNGQLEQYEKPLQVRDLPFPFLPDFPTKLPRLEPYPVFA